MIVYISGKITGIPHEEALEKFQHFENKLVAAGHQPINPMKITHGCEDWEDFMIKDISVLMKEAEAVLFLPCWTDSKGARIEHAIAKELGLQMNYAEIVNNVCNCKK